jgi:hypothetical protein
MPAIRKLLSNYLPNIFGMGASHNTNNNIPTFSTRPPSLHPMSIRSVDMQRRSRMRFTGDDMFRGEGGNPSRCSLDVSAVSIGR